MHFSDLNALPLATNINTHGIITHFVSMHALTFRASFPIVCIDLADSSSSSFGSRRPAWSCSISQPTSQNPTFISRARAQWYLRTSRPTSDSTPTRIDLTGTAWRGPGGAAWRQDQTNRPAGTRTSVRACACLAKERGDLIYQIDGGFGLHFDCLPPNCPSNTPARTIGPSD